MQTNFCDQTNQQLPFCPWNKNSKETRIAESQQFDSETLIVSSENQIHSYIEKTVNQGNYAVAISLINELISRYPNSAINYNNRGLMYFRNNQLSEALDDLTHALEINPKLDSAYNNRANCHAAQGNLIAAVSDYDEALDLNPTNLRAWINQGITFRDLDFFDLALENFDIALIVGNSLQERIHGERGRTYHLRGDWNCAVADYQTALQLLSNQGDLQSYQSKVQGWLDDLLNPIK
ncbi:Tetratricopeptide TPR_2 repeat protein [Hyella patelloides LEGE 07179]|uniref:Tetratricopeptide TPR_2 repeat protein n=1 Tax=Hyella patelloides LEGE 07179 TaxID=945734 RepID=A0A563VV49_9CYAN|nr:tetratricopeptide repeat protein [Hyella patelloides]VEP15151.1 Tetratricopeptide TPR_2 repeat protein [Hyella patelloides LEGE 07179]